MALKINLKQNERIIVNGAVVSLGKKAGEIIFLNHARILHQHHVLTEEKIKDPDFNKGDPRNDSWFYYLIQLIYIDPENVADYLDKMATTVDLVIQDFPDKGEEVKEILGLIADGQLYKALNACREAFPNCLTAGKDPVRLLSETTNKRPKLELPVSDQQ
jgi:flagellar protein FlbT